MTKTEIINETVEYYKTNPKGIDDEGNCIYYDPTTGGKCAIGRCLIDAPAIQSNVDTWDNANSLEEKFGLDNLLKEEYRGHEVYFWTDLQILHDSYIGTEADNKGITTRRIEFLIEKYKDK